MREKGNDKESMREQIAEVLFDFASIILEEVSCQIDVDSGWEVTAMDRIGGVIRAFRQGDTSIENVYKANE